MWAPSSPFVAVETTIHLCHAILRWNLDFSNTEVSLVSLEVKKVP